ncbi:ankyrin repeat domain-containing protein [Clostridium sp. HBUAS56010]|uniref:ankyrin repeat domain-containing protein n=1 Tax=Clostridium sp. HBUAS56010 TaxID=2571127 RepID=UPI001FAA9D45|nr:ankyrin repeat domain-containing protein [Clostridium sp. HBUAS56010]
MTLVEAVKSKNQEQVRTVIYEDPQAIKREGKEAVFLAAREGDLAVLKYLVEYSAVNMGERDESGRSPLFSGVLSGNLEVVAYLVERVGLSPLEGDLKSRTPYDLAHETAQTAIEDYFSRITGAAYEDTYHNPVIKGFSSDPSILRVGEDYYMVHSSFCYFPCIPLENHKQSLIPFM